MFVLEEMGSLTLLVNISLFPPPMTILLRTHPTIEVESLAAQEPSKMVSVLLESIRLTSRIKLHNRLLRR